MSEIWVDTEDSVGARIVWTCVPSVAITGMTSEDEVFTVPAEIFTDCKPVYVVGLVTF